jgi:predicted nucleotidyltransferase component of viral defense system
MLTIHKHREILFDILRDIYHAPFGAYLGFKGGTMLYFFHGLDRFSVDLDFDLLPGGDAEAVSNGLRAVLRRYGSIEDEAEKYSTLFFLLRYESGQQGIKIEVSQREQPYNRYETKSLYGVDVRVLSLQDSFAHKLVATTERQRFASRDFYDVYFLFRKSVPIREEIIRNRTGLSAPEQLRRIRELVEKRLSPNTALEGIGELVDASQKEWLKSDFKNDLLARLDFAIDEYARREDVAV